MVLDKTPNSLIELWDWFSNHIEVCTKDEQELMFGISYASKLDKSTY